MKFCHSCAQRLKDVAKFCHSCGAKQYVEGEAFEVVDNNAEEMSDSVERMVDVTPDMEAAESTSSELVASVSAVAPVHYGQQQQTPSQHERSQLGQEVDRIVKDVKYEMNRLGVSGTVESYWQYFLATLKSPGKVFKGDVTYYGVISAAIYLMAQAFLISLMTGTAKEVSEKLLSTMYTAGVSADLWRVASFFNNLYDPVVGMFRSMLGLMSIVLGLFIVYRYLLQRKSTFLHVLERYTSYTTQGTVLLLGMAILFKLQLFLLCALLVVAYVVHFVMMIAIVPALVLTTEEQKGAREVSPFYSVLITLMLSGVVGFLSFVLIR